MATGNLIIDKASVDMNYLFKSLKIVESKNNIISRYDFVREMELYMNGRIVSSSDETEESRTQFNKTKLARYYGLLRTTKDDNGNQFIILTRRGKQICKIITENDDKSFTIDNINKLREIILYSILYDTFGRNNDGVETSNSDIEPPKILLKSVLKLGYIKSEELIYLIYSLNHQDYDTFDDAINHIIKLREEENQIFIQNKIEEFEKTNFVADNKLLSFFSKIKILYKDNEKRYYYEEEFINNYKNIIQQLDPVSKNVQLIIYGITGTGKSHFINNIILGNIVETKQVIRTIIHPDYSYSDFIGYIVPHTIDNKIVYDYQPGPFSLALKKAIENPKTNIYLVIEEINRGNISAIFGDTFQLLDRISDYKSLDHNKSKYKIENDEIYNYLKEALSENYLKRNYSSNKIYLPSNLNIICTMNTADQNRALLDTAFRRRFNNLIIKLNDNDTNSDYMKTLNLSVKEKIFDNKYDWIHFIKKINKFIDKCNKNYYTISEDKKLAPFFVNLDDVNNKNSFADKVIYYLKNDVFKYNNNVLKEDYSSIKKKFLNGYDILEEFEVDSNE